MSDHEHEYDPVKDRRQRLIKTVIGPVVLLTIVIGLASVMTRVGETSETVSKTTAEDGKSKKTRDRVKRAQERIAEDAKIIGEEGRQEKDESITKFKLPTINVRMDILKDLPAPVAQVAKHVRPVRVVFDNGEFKFGTGILIGNGQLMTCDHLTRNMNGANPAYVQYTCKEDDESLETSNPILSDPTTDTAFIKVDCPAETLKWRTNAPFGLTVWVVGIEYNGTDGLILSSVTQNGPRLDQMKHLRNEREKLNQEEWIKDLREAELELPGTIFTQIRYGNSGSLVTDTGGDVLGMVFKGADMPFGVYMPTANLRRSAEKLGVDLGDKRRAYHD